MNAYDFIPVEPEPGKTPGAGDEKPVSIPVWFGASEGFPVKVYQNGLLVLKYVDMGVDWAQRGYGRPGSLI